MRFDNAEFSVVGDRDDDFASTMRLVFQLEGWSDKPNAKAYEIRTNVLSILWSTDEDSVMFPTYLGVEEVIPIAMAWLREAEYDIEPDHDGDNKKGWHISQCRSNLYTICSIEPRWTMYDK